MQKIEKHKKTIVGVRGGELNYVLFLIEFLTS